VNPFVRKDIQSKMAGADTELSRCYAASLTENRELSGQIVLAFETAPDTGAFRNVRVVKDTVKNDALSTCVVSTVSQLKLKKPTGVIVAVEQFPLEFRTRAP
jgi:hypothetical protein